MGRNIALANWGW